MSPESSPTPDTSRARILLYSARAATLVGSAIASQAVNFIGILVLARLYQPAEVGLFGLFNAVFGFALLAASWRYELAIVTVEDDGQADDVALFVVMAGLSSALLAVVVLVVVEMLPEGAGISAPLRRALMAVPPSLIITSLILAGMNLCVRRRMFGRVALQQIAIAVATVGAQVLLVDTPWLGGGMVAGFVLGQLGAAVILAGPLLPVLITRLRLPRVLGRLSAVAREHRGHFLYTVPYSLLVQLYYQAPVILLGGLFGASEVGFFNLAFRTTTAPLSLLPAAVAQVFFPDMARDRRQLAIWEPRLLTLLVGLGILLAPVAAVVLAWGPDIFALILGERWRQTGMFAQIIIVSNLIMTLASGYDRIYFILERQRSALALKGGACAASMLMMLMGSYLSGNPFWLVGGWAGVHLVFAFAWMFAIFHIAHFSSRDLASRCVFIMGVIGILALGLAFGHAILDGEPRSVAIVAVTGLVYAAIALRVGLPLRALLRRNSVK